MLPLACRLVSIEVQDDYYQLMSSKLKGQINIDRSITGQISSAWENFVDQTWDVLFESRHQKLKADQQQTKQEELDVVRRNRRLQQHQHRKHITREETRDNKSSDYTELANQRVRLLEEYVRPALLPTGSEQDLMRNLFTTQQQNDIQSSNYDYFVKWIRGEYLIAKYGLAVQQAVKEHPTLRDDVANLNSVGGTQSLDGEEVEVPLTLLLPKLDTIIRAFDMGQGPGEGERRMILAASGVHGSRQLQAVTQAGHLQKAEQVISQLQRIAAELLKEATMQPLRTEILLDQLDRAQVVGTGRSPRTASVVQERLHRRFTV